MSKNEAETRYELIDPILRDKGYRIPYIKLETPAPVEPIGPKGRRRKGPGKIDYLLCVEVHNGPKPLPIAILEAKQESEDPLKGMQQAKGYSDCARFDAKYVFSTNGHLYAKYSKFTGEQTGPFPFGDFPDHAQLTDCFAKHTGIKVTKPEASIMFMADSPAYPESRYYQDAAIRSAFEKIIQCEQAGDPARVLLSLATGAGKTVIAANLLWRLHEAERLPKPPGHGHVGVHREWELSALRRSSEHLAKAGCRHRSSSLCEKHMPRLGGAPRGSPYDALAPASSARAA
jgi:type I restriction enzyme R subunit